MTVHWDTWKVCRECGDRFFWDDEQTSVGSWTSKGTCTPECQKKRENARRREKAPSSSSEPPKVREFDPWWRNRAACLGEDPELFFAVGDSGPARMQNAEAKLVCFRCPVVVECLTWALESGQVGIWGGTDEDERRALKQGNTRTKARVS